MVLRRKVVAAEKGQNVRQKGQKMSYVRVRQYSNLTLLISDSLFLLQPKMKTTNANSFIDAFDQRERSKESRRF